MDIKQRLKEGRRTREGHRHAVRPTLATLGTTDRQGGVHAIPSLTERNGTEDSLEIYTIVVVVVTHQHTLNKFL